MCPHWAIAVNPKIDDNKKEYNREHITGSPRLLNDPPLAGCPGCQHPTVGRIIIEALDELDMGPEARMLEAIPRATSSAFGLKSGEKLTLDELLPDVATYIKHNSPESVIVAVQGYWGLSDFSFDIN